MSKTISGFLTGIVWGTEGTQGTVAATSPYLWNSEESDGLTFGEEPLDLRPMDGGRGQSKSSFRVAQNLPGGALGAIPMHFGTDATEALLLLQAHYQSFTEAGTAAPYTYTFTPILTAIEDGSFSTLSFSKEVGEADQAHQYLGCIVDELEMSWETNGAIMFNPTVKAMSSSNDATMPLFPAVPTDGFMQAPNIAVSWRGTTVYPSAWSITSKNSSPDKQSGSARGRQAHAVGDFECEITIDVWRNDGVDTLFVSPFYDNSEGTLVITATMDVGYGTITGAVPVEMVITAECMVQEPDDLPTGNGDLIDTFVLKVVNDTALTVALNADSTGLIT